MNIRNIKDLKITAGQQLGLAREEKRIVLIFSCLVLGLSALVTVVNYILGLRIEDTGGLGNMGTRAVLSTVQMVLPMVQSMVVSCVTVGYLSAMLRISRGQYASPNSLRLGFDRFWVLLRSALFQGMLYTAIIMTSVYAATMLYMLTPLMNPVTELLIPYIEQIAAGDMSAIVEDAALYSQLLSAMTPLFLIWGVLFLLAAVPLAYSYRMVNYVIIDKPALGALAALRESKQMMRGNRMALLKLDLSCWWYYLVLAAASVLCYGDVILAMLGITLPVPAEVAYFLFYGLYLAAEFVIYYFLRSRMEVTYALAYDAVKPVEKESSGVVLGNIFQM